MRKRRVIQEDSVNNSLNFFALNQEIIRIKKIIDEAILKTSLDLTGLTVLTEVGSKSYLFTPIIAAMANAKKIFAWSADSQYGLGKENVNQCRKLLKELNIHPSIKFSVNKRPVEDISSADIITNLGFVRPLNNSFLVHVNSHAVISLMYEKWELRKSDINIDYCRRRKIPVAGTWENHPALKIFNYCGVLAVKMAMEAGYEIFQNRIIVWSDDNFGSIVEKEFKKLGASKVIRTTRYSSLLKHIENTDFVFFCDYSEKRRLLGRNGLVNLRNIVKINPAIGIIHLYGDIDNEFVKKHGVKIFPDKKGIPSVMSFTLAHTGLVPVLYLQTAGLKVGECLLKNDKNKLVQRIC